MKTTFLVTISALYCLNVAANTKKADRLFDHWEYFRAAKQYEKEAAKRPCANIYFKLGECYRKMNMRKEEQAAFDKVHAYGIYSKPEFYLNYGQVLKSNGKNIEAKLAFDKYSELEPTDARGKFFSESIVIVAKDHEWDQPIPITNVTKLNTAYAELCPVIYKDGLVFTSNRKTPGRNKIYGWTGANYLNLYFAHKGVGDLDYTNISTFGNSKIIKKFSDGPACFSKNFDTIYISRVDKDLKGKQKEKLKIERNKIFVSAMKGGKWTQAVPFYLNNDAFSVANPFLTTDGSRMYFVSDMPGGFGETDIYYCNRDDNQWGAPINIGPNINTYNREKYPAMDAKGNFYFSSDGYQGFGGMDICVALNNGGTLAKAIPMKSPLNSPADDFGIAFLKDGKTGYLTSNRENGGIPSDDIYLFKLKGDDIDTGLSTSIYTIGYRPKTLIPIISPPLTTTSKSALPDDIFIHFDFDKAQLRPTAITNLDSVVHYMNEFPTFTLLVTGHCDCRGTSDYNIDLAIRRSEAVVRFLCGRGIGADRMKSEGYGKNNKFNSCVKGVNYTEPEYQSGRWAYIHFQEY